MEDIDQKILESVLELFAGDSTEHVSVTAATICEKAGITPDEFLDRFQGAGQVLSLSYLVLLDEAKNNAESFSGFELLALEERLATFCFVLLDVFERHERFVSTTFHQRASGFWSPFQQQLREIVSELLVATDVSSANRFLFDSAPIRVAVAESFVQIIQIWIVDDSADRERSTALIDRVVAWWAELLTNGIADRTVDLLRYAVEAGYLPLNRIPIVGDWFGGSEKKTG